MSSFARFLLSIPMGGLYGWAGSLLWGWFVVPLGAPAVTLWHVWGLFLMLGMVKLYLLTVDSMPDKTHPEADARGWAMLVFKALMILLSVGIASLVQMGVPA